MLDILKPGRYINNEWHSVHKEWSDSKLKVALCFPDIYEIGMSHLGMKILYGILNNEHDIICERFFVPWVDMEKHMREKKEAILSLESKCPLHEFDIIGFSLQYEMNYTDVLNMLELGRVPIYSKDRDDNHPLVIAGGPCAFNPEPMADFIDAFVIGEAEEIIVEIAKLVKGLRFKVEGFRNEILKALAKIEGVYVPNILRARPEGPSREVLDSLRSLEQYSNTKITKRIVKDLDNSYFPTSPIVPYIQIVHDRIAIEIMRGCPHRCKFCQARKIFHPLRIRSVQRIMEIAESSIRNTGYEELSLLSLSSGDYPHIEELMHKLEEKFTPLGVKISLPSLRAGSFNSHDEKKVLKRAGLTFAPEAGSERLREILNKDITDGEIIEKSKLAIQSGWKKVKLYFMIGLPGEIHKDLDAIIELASKIKNVNLSISAFIPKPHSDFEREGMEGLDAQEEKIAYIRRKSNMKMYFHDPKMSRIEAVLSRGDRLIGKVIFRAYEKGVRLQAWTDYFEYRLWEEAFQEAGIDPAIYLRRREVEEILPWSFITW